VKFSIITICLNADAYLAETIASVLDQDFQDLEYIIIDGGSTDRTLDIIRSYRERDNRIIWISEADQGISDAMNKGLSIATGDVVAFLHADDSYTTPDVIPRMAEFFFTSPDKNWVTGGIREINEYGVTLRLVNVRRFSWRRLLRNNIILHPATFVRRQAIEQVGGFDSSLHYAMDYDLWLRLAAYGAPVEISHTLANFRVHQGSRSSVNLAAALNEEYLVRRRYLYRPISRVCHALYHHWRSLALARTKSRNGYHAPTY